MLEKYSKRQKIKIGFAPTRRVTLDKAVAGESKRLIEKKLSEYNVEYINLDWLNEEGLLFNIADGERAAKKFVAEGVDAVFAPHCNFGTEDSVAKLAKLTGKPLLLWGPRDDRPSPEGYRLTDSQCGMFATSKVLQRMGVPFSYITNCSIEDETFDKGFRNFMSAASVVKAFKTLRIGQISTRPQAFWSVICNEGELLERFGIEIVPTTMVDIQKETESILADNGEELKTEVESLKNRLKSIRITDDGLNKLVALKLAIRHWADNERLSGVAIQCWSALQKALGVAPCFINGELTGEGLPVACETDIHGAITEVMAQAAGLGEKPVFLADLTIRHPDNDNAELLWHCGNFPLDLAGDDSERALTEHFEMLTPGAGAFELSRGDVTICRFDGIGGEYSFLMGHGKAVGGPKTVGTFQWVEFNDWPLWEEKFMYGPYIHHCVGIRGKLAPALYESCKFIPGLNADPVDPTEEEIRKFLRG
jgi:L-fucose isomerase-like protein